MPGVVCRHNQQVPTTSSPDPAAGHVDRGHSVLAVPVPALDGFVRERTAWYDGAYLAEDPHFGQAHVTVLAPWLREPCAEDLATIARIAAAAEPFDYLLAATGVFPNGIIHLVPDPVEPFQGLTQQAWDAFPDHPPYAGHFAGVTPHVTLDAVGPGVDEAHVRDLLGDRIPVTCHADRVQLQWWQAGHCHVRATWHLGGATTGGTS